MTLEELTKESTEVTIVPKDKRKKPYLVSISELTLSQLESIVTHQVINGYIVPSLVTEKLSELLKDKIYNER